MKRVTIVIPVFNTPEEYLYRCLQSVSIQDYSDYETIIVDDGSKAETALACERLSSSLLKNAIVVHQDNLGLSCARNTGIRFGTGDYYYFLDSDDALLGSFSISYLMSIADNKEKECDMVFGKLHIKSEIEYLEEVRYVSGLAFYEESLQKCGISFVAPDSLYSKELLSRMRTLFVEGLVHEDEEFTPRALCESRVIAVCQQVSTYTRFIVEDSITQAKDEQSCFKRCAGKLRVCSLTLTNDVLPHEGRMGKLNALRGFSFANMAFRSWATSICTEEFEKELLTLAEEIDYRMCPLLLLTTYHIRTFICMTVVRAIGIRQYVAILRLFCR